MSVTKSKNLFQGAAEAGLVAPPVPAARRGPLTAQQQRFNRLIAKVEKTSQTLALHQQLADTHRARQAALVAPLLRQERMHQRAMVRALHEHLQRKGWTQVQRSTMQAILCALTLPFIEEGDREMLALHDQYSPRSHAEQQKEAQAHAAEAMAQMLGVSLDHLGEYGSVEEMLRASLHQAREKAQAEAQAKEQARSEKAARQPGKRQQKAEQEQAVAQGTLREVYRKLASALHPDREPDDSARAHKSALMSEANRAYERRDLLALLRLQLRIQQIDPGTIARIAGEKLDAMTLLLKTQARTLENELHQLDEHIRHEFDLPWSAPLSAKGLAQHLSLLARQHQGHIEAMRDDLRRVADERQIKPWLKAQRAGMAEAEREDELIAALFEKTMGKRR